MSKWVIHRSIFWTQSIDLDSPAHSPLASNKMIPLVCQHGVPFTSWLLQQAANERQSHLKEATMATHLSVTAPLPADCPATSPPPPPPRPPTPPPLDWAATACVVPQKLLAAHHGGQGTRWARRSVIVAGPFSHCRAR